MINLAIAYDDNDNSLGDYFEDSYTNINDSLDTAIVSTQAIRGLDCSENNVTAVILAMPRPFIFVGLSHGNTDLLEAEEPFVCANNVQHFDNSFFYTTGCCAAVELGPWLIEIGCKCFIGYTDDSLATYDDFYDIYINCETYSIKEFLNSEKTILQTYEEMLSYFDNRIDELFTSDDILVAMELQTNKDRLTWMGDSTLTRNDFMVA